VVRSVRLVVTLLAGVTFAAGSLVFGASDARPAQAATVTINILDTINNQPGWDVLIANFERVYPDIKVDITYAPTTTTLYQLEATELAAGNAPDVLSTTPGCGTPIAVCVLAKAGDLAPLVNKPWVKWSVPLVTSGSKYGQALVAFAPLVGPPGIFTNDSLFGKLGLKVPQTFVQLLDVCRKAKAAGAAAVLLAGGSPAPVTQLITELAVATVYGQDKSFLTRLRAGKVTFEGTPGWHQALQHFIDMNTAGCFQPGATGVSSGTAAAVQFGQGQGLMLPLGSRNKATIDAASPQFRYSFHPIPGGTSPTQTTTYLNTSGVVSVNAHSSSQNQAAAQTFIDFIARPKQNALFAQALGGVTQYEFLHGQIPAWMTDFAPVFEQHKYVVNPTETWWNPTVLFALQQNQIGLITGQRSIDDVLNAMDAAWKQGPA
jgi:raffinose/stachyose/melibiose transport system substrate-binding protein